MALTTNTRSNSMGVVNFASGAMVSDAGAAEAATINLGFVPRSVKFVNLTDRISYEYHEGQAAGDSLKTVAAGTRTIDSGVLTVSGSDVTISAAGMIASKSFAWEAQG
jgi:hypothetical protein